VADPQWVPFVGLTAVVLVLLLALARVSQRVVRDDESPPSGSPQSGTDSDGQVDTEDGTADAPVYDSTAELVERHALAEGSLAYDRTWTDEDRPDGPGADRHGATDESVPELTTGMLLANVALTQGLFGGVVLAGAYFYDIPGWALGITGDPWNAGLPAVAVGVAFGVSLWLANEASASVADAVGATYDEALREQLAPDSPGGWAILLGAVLPVVAFVEEFLFRAAIIGVPAAGFGVSPWVLAVLSSGAFALGHGAQGRVGVVVTGGLGLVLAGGFVVSGSLLVVVIAHYLVNALEFLVHEWLGYGRLLV